MGQSVQSLGAKALAHPHWAGKTGYAVLAMTLVAVCGVAAVVLPLMFLLAGMAKNLFDGKVFPDADYIDCVERQNETAHAEWVESMDE